MNETEYLVDFRGQTRLPWRPVNDGVMGGLSQSDIRVTGEGTGLFTGVLSLENNGGFASVRTSMDRSDFSDYAGIELRVRGDGRNYQLRFRSDDRFDGITYRVEFPTRRDEWTTTYLPFELLRPSYRGRILRDVPAFDPSRIRQMGFMLADKTAGEFSLEIEFVRASKPPVEQ